MTAARVVVLGAGAAGAGAAIAASGLGARTTMLDGGPGASSLATGAIDVAPWQERAPRQSSISPDVLAALDRLGGYEVPAEGVVVLTTAGIARPATGHDAALLDVGRIQGGRIGVVRCGRPGWDARTLARSWGASFEVLDAVTLRHADEHVIPDSDFARRHDDDARLGWLGERLREAMARKGGTFDALVLPPSLGVEHPRAADLSRRAGVRCGEALAMPGGPAGLRFERARDRALSSVGVEHRHSRATRVERSGRRWIVSVEGGPPLEADSVVFATGGLLGGGFEYCPADSMHASALPPHARRSLRLTVQAPLTLGSRGLPLELPGSLFGSAPEALARPFAADALLDRAGVLAGEYGACVGGPPGLYAAGEVAADLPRTWLSSLSSGLRAGAAAAGGLSHERSTGSGGPLPGAGPASPP